MPHNISTVAGRTRLPLRREPYWQRITAGNYLGFRRLADGGTWIARHRNDEGKQAYQALGDFAALPDHQRFDAASNSAKEWFGHLDAGGSTKVLTVGDAISAYLAELRADHRTAAARHSQSQFKLHVLAHPIAKIELRRLKADNLKAWRRHVRDSLTPQGKPRSGASINRMCTILRAALNGALEAGHVVSDRAWKETLVADADAERSGGTYLDRSQRAALLAHASDEVRPFFEVLTLLPIRPGAAAALTVANFDKRTGVLHIVEDKANGDRKIKLQGRAHAFLTAQCKNKLPAAQIFTNTIGAPWVKDAWAYHFRQAASAAKLPSKTGAYDLRHSAITDLVEQGVATLTVAVWAGTSVLRIERNYYQHRPDHGAAALEALAL